MSEDRRERDTSGGKKMNSVGREVDGVTGRSVKPF